MRKLFATALIVAAILTSCKKDQVLQPINGHSLVGKWELVENYYSIGGPGSWVLANGGAYFIINENGNYTSYPTEDFLGTKNRIQLLNDSTLIRFATVASSGAPVKTDITYPNNFHLSDDGNEIVLWSRLCIEGCGVKFKRKEVD